MLLTKEDIASLRERLVAVRQQGEQYFDRANPTRVDALGGLNHSWVMDDGIRNDAETLRADVKALSVDIAGAVRGSPLLAEADTQELRQNTRRMLASVYFNEYHHTGVYVHHDEGLVLGVDPPSHTETPLDESATARRLFDRAAAGVLDLIDLLSPTDTAQSFVPGTSRYRPNTAFIMMAIDPNRPELEDVKNGIKEVFNAFGIEAIAADEIEHEGAITDRILDEIDNCEYHIADLTHERPNVYYEVGQAHARQKKVILFRRRGAMLHFDVAHRNCPEYNNTTDLMQQLARRLEAMTNRRGPTG